MAGKKDAEVKKVEAENLEKAGLAEIKEKRRVFDERRKVLIANLKH